MTVKFTKTGVGSEQNDETLLFEFLDHELPEKIELEYESDLITNQFVSSLQTNQHNGIYLKPISWGGKMFGQYVSKAGTYVTAKERVDELLRIQGRVVKFFYEGIKQLVIVKNVKIGYMNYMEVEYDITLQPHDIQLPVKPTLTLAVKENNYFNASTVIDTKKLNKHIGSDVGGSLPNIGDNTDPLGFIPARDAEVLLPAHEIAGVVKNSSNKWQAPSQNTPLPKSLQKSKKNEESRKQIKNATNLDNATKSQNNLESIRQEVVRATVKGFKDLKTNINILIERFYGE